MQFKSIIFFCRGLNSDQKLPFRKYYGQLGELQSLCPDRCRIVIVTATATSATKQQILSSLNLNRQNVVFIEHSPDRPNLFYTTAYLDKNQPLQIAFGSLIKELETMGKDVPRTIIYCQTRKQCALLFSMFEIYLGNKLFNGECKPKNRLVEMYHASTPDSVKQHVTDNMATSEGHMRVLISTVAFGMGVNCKKVRRIIHFGPSKTVEMYIQECGRAGREGEASSCILLHNGLLGAHCDIDVKSYIQTELCLRKKLMVHFSQSESISQSNHTPLHNCCKNCHYKCDCGECPELWNLATETDDFPNSYFLKKQHKSQFTRVVTNESKAVLQEKLIELKKDFQRNT